MSGSVYKVIELVGTSDTSWEDAAKNAPLPEIQVINVIQQDVPIYREFVGQVYGFQDIPIRARVEGFLEDLHFDEGYPVKKGDLLYTIDSQPFAATHPEKNWRVARRHRHTDPEIRLKKGLKSVLAG